MGFDISIPIQALPSTVWDLITDVESWPEWTPSMTKVTRLDTGPFVKGSRARIKQPKMPTLIWTVLDLTVGVSFVWAAQGPGFKVVATHRIVDNGDGSVTVNLAVAQSGLLGQLIAMLTSRTARRYVVMEAEGLKRRSEQL